MYLLPVWQDIAARLLLTVLAGSLIGLDREARGHAAGLGTTILVGLAAAIAMTQATILLGVSGKSPHSFARMDVLRFPLGVLTGVGLIGGGAILRRGSLVSGVTTAATLWMMTMIGLAFGGGQYVLGAAGTALTLVILLVLKWVDLVIPRERHAVLTLTWKAADHEDLDAIIGPSAYRARLVGIERRPDRDSPVVSFEISWRRSERAPPPTDLLTLVGQHCEIEKFELRAESCRSPPRVIARRAGRRQWGFGSSTGSSKRVSSLLQAAFDTYLSNAGHASEQAARFWRRDREVLIFHFMADGCRNGSATA
jgi:putative Mg2+ transporter-C (MgtC) family protein